jgi:hypothetical protein
MDHDVVGVGPVILTLREATLYLARNPGIHLGEAIYKV